MDEGCALPVGATPLLGSIVIALVGLVVGAVALMPLDEGQPRLWWLGSVVSWLMAAALGLPLLVVRWQGDVPRPDGLFKSLV